MFPITAQQTQLDLELIRKENRLDFRKYNGRIPHGLTPIEPTFLVVLDAIALTPCYLAFLITADVPEVYMRQFWNSMYKHDTFYGFKIDKKKQFKLTLEVFRDIFHIFPRIPVRDFDALPSKEDIVSLLRELGHTGEINSLNDVVVDQMHQPWRTFVALINRGLSGKTSGLDKLRLSPKLKSFRIYEAILPECFTNPAIKESKAYKTYLSYATGDVPSNIARKFKKAFPFKKDSDLVHVDKQPVTKGKRVKRSVKKSSTKPTTALTKEAQIKEVKKKSLRDFHKTHLSGSSTVAEKPPRVDKITPTVLSEGISNKPGVPNVTKDDSTESELGSWGNDEDDSNDDNDLENEGNDKENKSNDDKTPSYTEKCSESEQDTDGSESESESDQQEYEEEVKDDDEDDEYDDDDDDKSKGDEDKGMDDMTNQFSNDVQDKKVDVEMTDAKQEKENLKITQEQVVEDTHVTIMNVAKETKVLDASVSYSSDLASKFLNFLDIYPNDAEIVSSLDVHVQHVVPRIHTSNLLTVPVLDPLHTQVTDLFDHLYTRMRATKEEFMNFLSVSLTDRITKQVRNQLPQILPEEVSNFAPPMIEKMIEESLNQVNQAKQSRQDKDKDEGPFARSDQGSKKRKTSKYAIPTIEPTNPDWNEDNTPQKGLTQKWLMTLDASTSIDKSLKDFYELMSTPIDFSSYILNGLKIYNLTQEILLETTFRLLKGTRSNYAKLKYDFEECYKALLEKLDWENPKGGDYPFDLSKPLPLITSGNHQRVPVEFLINNDLKYLQGGISYMTYTMSTTKTKATQYDLPSIKDMVPKIWSPIKVDYDKYALWGIYTGENNVITHDLVMRKHGYGYLEEIVVRRADNVLYRFKEGDDVADFAIALRMFTESLVIQKRVKDLQLGVESYQKQINITKPDTTRPDLRKIYPYTPYKDPQGFIYFDDYKRNRLMRSDEL
nr:hypothetical protein [Tanacetum cinerariifolium]